MGRGQSVRFAMLRAVAISATVLLVCAHGHAVAVDSTTRVSIASDGTQANSGSETPSISADGRFVAFFSDASNLVDSDTNGRWDVFVRDTVTSITRRVSVGSDGTQGDGDSGRPSVSADGRFVAFYSDASNLVAGDTNSVGDLFVRDTVTGVTRRVSVASDGTQGDGPSWHPAISADGRFVAFHSGASNLVFGDTNGQWDVFVHDAVTGTTDRVSVASDGTQGDDTSLSASVSADGRFVAFSSRSSNLVAGDTNNYGDIFVRDTIAGTTQRISVSSDGTQANNDVGNPSISADGRLVAFESQSSNLVAGDTNGGFDIFVHDAAAGTTRRASIASDGAQTNDDSWSVLPSISADGCSVAFCSDASNLVSGDTNGECDVFASPIPIAYTEVAGANRYTTAIEASKRAYPEGASTVVIATGANWPDALGGAALAGIVEGPLLLTTTNALPDAVLAEVKRLEATDAYILGGTGAVSTAVENTLKANLAGDITRLAGANRYGTANAVADEVIALSEDTADGFGGKAFIATGANFPDALGASPLAASSGTPILLAPTGGTPYLPDAVDSAVILGGTGAVTSTTEAAVKTELGATNVTRVGGTDRYDTAALVAEHGVASGMRWDGVGIATGAAFPDALSGGAMLGSFDSVLLLTRPTSLVPVAEQRLAANKASIDTVFFIGGTGAVSQAVRDKVAQVLQ